MSRLTFRSNEVTNGIHPFVTWDDFFTDEELAQIEEYCSQYELEDGTVSRPDNPNATFKQVRDSKIKFFNPNSDNQWIFNKLRSLAELVNNEFYRFDLVGFNNFQYTVYDKAGSNYGYHCDMFMGSALPDTENLHRKLSFSLLLSDNSDFTGGEFDFLMSGDQDHGFITAKQQRGRVVAFPSWMVHRVAPIKTGVRKSLVFWVTGPKFK